MPPNNPGNRDRKQALVAALTLLGASLGVNTHADASEGTKGTSKPSESISLNFSKIEVSYPPTSNQHKGEKLVNGKWIKIETATPSTQIHSTHIKVSTDTPSALFLKKNADTPSAIYMKKNADTTSAIYMKKNAVVSKQNKWVSDEAKHPTDTSGSKNADATINWGDGTTSSDQKKNPAPGKAH